MRGQRAQAGTSHGVVASPGPSPRLALFRGTSCSLGQSHSCLFREQQQIKQAGLLDFVSAFFSSPCLAGRSI